MVIQRVKRALIGQPIASDRLSHETIPKWKALAVLSSDALSSVAYATEEILIPLSLFSVAAMAWSLPIALFVGVLLFIITISYRQTIDSYPGGGGSYTVSKENLGTTCGLISGAALMIDYILTVAVSISAGVENIAAAFPFLFEHKVFMGVILIGTVMVLNLRGIRESSSIFALPTYFFIGSFLLLIVSGFIQMALGHASRSIPEIAHQELTVIPAFLILKAFSSGCSALTGVEAISNGIPMFRKPSPLNAKITMVWMSAILGVFFISITVLAQAYQVRPMEGQTIISGLSASILGSNTILFYLVQISVAMILILAANTSFADFPRLAHLLAKDGFLPRQFAYLGDRLVFSNGIIGLSGIAALLVIMFKGSTHLLIPLYAVGVFLSFTLSQSGMVVHHYKTKRHWFLPALVNALGAITTATVLIVIGMSKFTSGAWAVMLLIPGFIFLFLRIHQYYDWIRHKLYPGGYYPPEQVSARSFPAVVPISGVHPGVVDALNYALSISSNVSACYVNLDQNETERIKRNWNLWAKSVHLEILDSPYRSIITPLIDYIEKVKKDNNAEMISVIVPEFVVPRWYQNFLHNQTFMFLRTMLRLKKGIVVVNVRYHLVENK